MLTDLRRAAVALVVFTVLVGLAYPLLMFGVGQVAFRGGAEGSLVRGTNGQVVGSRLIGQAFDAPEYSGAGPRPPGTATTPALPAPPTGARPPRSSPTRCRSGSTLLLAAHPGATTADIPGELVTASGSGLDPDISPAAAAFQVDRVAAARRLDPAKVRELVRDHTQGRTWGSWASRG